MPKKGWVRFSNGHLHCRRSLKQTAWFLLPFAIAFSMSLAFAAHSLSSSPSTLVALVQRAAIAQTDTTTSDPDFPLQPHPLPPTLARWRDPKQTGDYFDQVQVVPVGYLIWTHFPITVYIQPPTAAELAIPFSAKRSQVWVTAVSQAIQEWQLYLPLKLVNQADGADIAVWRTEHSTLTLTPVQPTSDSQTDAPPGQTRRDQPPALQLGRVRSAVTRYEIYAKGLAKDAATAKDTTNPMLAQRFTIQLRPDQASSYIQAAARHELGHALGLWGHSRSQTDVMYFSQVRHPPPISPRDLNTLKRVYEQPTRLGWALTE